MKPSYIIMAAVFAVSSPALANENWQEKDTNGDGQLSRAEHDAGVAAAWTAKDADGNGQLSTAEAGMKAGTHWTAADTDGDGQLSQSEFTAMKAAWFSKARSEEHTSELQSLMRISYAVLCLKKNKTNNQQ